MNEKIKELFEQAYGGEWPTDITNIAPSELERFAKLIVNECVQICRDNIMCEETDLDYNDAVIDCAVMIERHFGVK
jgi:hypothetical protein